MWLAKARWLRARHLPPLPAGEGPIDCFMLLNEPRLWEGIWSLYSFRRFFGPCRLVVLSDGTLRESSINTIKEIFPNIIIPDAAENDLYVSQYLHRNGLTLCKHWRKNFVFFRKLIDPLLLSRSEKVLLLDSDILHFRPPTAIAEWSAQPDRFLYISDPKENPFCADIDDIQRIAGMSPTTHFCAGYICFRIDMINLSRIENYLKDRIFENQRISNSFNHTSEQTIYAMESAFSHAVRLPASYATCPDPYSEEVIMGHFCGGESTRYRFYTIGLRLLASEFSV